MRTFGAPKPSGARCVVPGVYRLLPSKGWRTQSSNPPPASIWQRVGPALTDAPARSKGYVARG